MECKEHGQADCRFIGTGLHVLCIYLWQIDALRWDDLAVAAEWVGIFRLSSASGNAVLVPQVSLPPPPFPLLALSSSSQGSGYTFVNPLYSSAG